MIKGLTSSSPFITVSGGGSSGPYISPGSAGAGMVRYNPNTQNLEVNDGNCWIELSASYASVDLSYEANDLLNWAREERRKQQLRQERIKKNPALQKAYEAIRRAEENFDMLDTIIGENNEYQDSV